ADGEARIAGHTYGSVSNLVLSLTAVVWDPAKSQYVLKTFQRNDPGIQPLLAHLGRSLIISATLQAGPNQRVRCQSFYDVPASELFAPQGSSGGTMASSVAASGRVESIWFPFTDKPWLKVWTIAPQKPLLSLQVDGPYNYPFSDQIPQTAIDLIT